jgi:predicted O-methyltransferase YrrM
MNRVIPYIPEHLWKPQHLVDVPTAWDGVESILRDVMLRFKIFPGTALEFGVDYGYSTAALANFFNRVIGVDHFKGDNYAGFRDDTLITQTERALKDFKNIRLVPVPYEYYIALPSSNDQKYDLIHVDIIHEYKPTNELVAWAIQHSDVVMVHDTIAFPEVRRAVQDVSWESGRVFYEYQVKHGVGFLVKE